MFDIKKFEKVNLKNPILVEGLPGIANVARITVDFLIEKMGAKKIYEIRASSLPAFVIVDEDSTIDLPKVGVYHARRNEKDFVLIVSDVQPSDEHNYALCEKLIELLKPSEIITIGGIGVFGAKDEKRIHGATTTPRVQERISYLPILFDGNDSVSLIVGAAGVLLGLAKMKDIPAFALLVETDALPTHFGIKGAKAVLEVLNIYLQLDFDFSDIKRDVKAYEKELRKRAKTEDEIKEFLAKHNIELDPRYIG